MSLTVPQQRRFRLWVAEAWRSHARAHALDPKDAAAKDKWYRAELRDAVGKESTTQCNHTSDFDKLKYHFGALCSDFDAVYDKESANARRILWVLEQYAKGHNIDEDYLRRIARQTRQSAELPRLRDLSATELLTILRAAKIHLRRRLHQGDPTLTPGPTAPAWAHPETEDTADPF